MPKGKVRLIGVIRVIILRDQDNILFKYGEIKNQIGTYNCKEKEIDEDTTIVGEIFSEGIIRTGSLAKDHEMVTLSLCTANVFCKCGEYHQITSDVPVKNQILEILRNIKNQEDLSFKFPEKHPTESLIIYNIEKKQVKKIIEDINDWL
jgi:hypothetical protein